MTILKVIGLTQLAIELPISRTGSLRSTHLALCPVVGIYIYICIYMPSLCIYASVWCGILIHIYIYICLLYSVNYSTTPQSLGLLIRQLRLIFVTAQSHEHDFCCCQYGCICDEQRSKSYFLIYIYT